MMFDLNKQVIFLKEGAKESFDDAQYLIKGNRVSLGLFAVHLALEKAIKVYVIEKTKEMPPRIHNLLTLANLASLELTPEQERLLIELNTFNIQGRYPDVETKAPSKSQVESIFNRAKDVFEWLMRL
jgi:HEPN domain-containing protein